MARRSAGRSTPAAPPASDDLSETSSFLEALDKLNLPPNVRQVLIDIRSDVVGAYQDSIKELLEGEAALRARVKELQRRLAKMTAAKNSWRALAIQRGPQPKKEKRKKTKTVLDS